MIYQIKIGGVIELEGELNPDNEYSICLERVGFDASKGYSSRINSNDVEVRTYKAENLGRVNLLTEKDKKPELIKGASKKITKSQILRLKIEASGRDYENTMNIILDNFEKLL